MSKMSKAIAALGVVAGLGVAALPLSSYAAIGDPLDASAFSRTATADVQVVVGSAISIATSKTAAGDYDGSTKTISLGDLMPGGITDDAKTETLFVKVTANNEKSTKYGLYINGLDGNTAMTGVKPGSSIPTLTAAGPLTATTSAWGYKTGDADGTTFDANYSPIPATATKIVDTTTIDGTDGAWENVTSIKFGASASTTQVPDTYTGHVVLTAALES